MVAKESIVKQEKLEGRVRYQLRKRRLTCHDSKPHKCEVCPRKFSRHSRLEKHMELCHTHTLADQCNGVIRNDNSKERTAPGIL